MRMIYGYKTMKRPLQKSGITASAEMARRATNVSLDTALLDEARALGINVSRACEHGLAEAVAEERARRWQHENQAAIASSNEFVERHGLPLARYRQF
jgi:antitoxin CcdA